MKTLYFSTVSILSFEFRRRIKYAITALILIFSGSVMYGQTDVSRIAHEIQANSIAFKNLQAISPLVVTTGRSADIDLAREMVEQPWFYKIHPEIPDQVIQQSAEWMVMELPIGEARPLRLQLKRADIFTSEFHVYTATDPETPFSYARGAYYWGVVEGHPQSLVALAFSGDEIMGFIQVEDKNYTLGKLKDDPERTHILYETDKLRAESGFNCFVDEQDDHINPDHTLPGSGRSASNCVRMYIQVDYDVFVQKGGVQQAADYVNGAFSQVAILYANEAINFTINEMFVWNVVDPFTGPTTSNYLSQFRSYLNGNYNGDLAHLVGYNGGGGIAYLDVLCNAFNGVGYSGINSNYANVPAYSWTVEVLTHEIGHNLGSPHTHACAWNGNNTAIDGCGPAAGYSEGCNAPLPTSGTIMSYCHLIGGVGINFNNGFGPQPGALIRNRVYNSSCLQTCGPAIQFDAGITAITEPISLPCSATVAPKVTLKNFGATTLTQVTIKYKLDNGAVQNYAWTGSLAQNLSATVTLPSITFGVGAHTLIAYTFNPNGQADEVPSNDQSSTSFTYYQDWCVCNAATASISPNPLTHSGNGSSSAAVSFASGSKKPVFTISNLDSKLNGQPQTRYIDVVTVTYVDGNGVNKTYGTFSGDQQSSVNVNIQEFVNSLSIALSNGYGNNYNGTLSVSFSAVNYCAPSVSCPDEDNDGVCDANDICPGFDDNLIGTPCNDGDACTQNDVYTTSCVCAGTPIQNCGCIEATSNFNPNPLTHVGPGQSSSGVTIPANHNAIAFVISNLDAKLNGNPNNRYIDEVTVNYVNSGGNTVQYGVFRGDQVSSVNVSIAGVVQSVTLILKDAYDGNSSTTLSVSMSPVTSCAAGGGLINSSGDGSDDHCILYPNPTSGDLMVRWDKAPAQSSIMVYNALGMQLYTVSVSEVSLVRIPLATLGLTGSQLLFVTLQNDNGISVVRRVMFQE